MTEVEQQPPPQNGIDLSAAEEDDINKARPADIEQDMREMERRKRVEAIMGSKLFREELERIVDSARDGGGILQQLSDIMGVPTSTRVSNVFKATNCMLPINDIRGVESMGYAKGEKILRCKLAATFRLLDLYGWTQGLGAQITARLKVDQENFLVNPYGMMYHEITASSLNRVDMQGQVVEQGTTNFGVNKNHFALHSVVHAARPDIRCAIYIGCTPVVAVSSLKVGLLPLTRDACVLGEVTTHSYTGTQMDADERDRLVRALGPNSKVLILSNYGALCCGETIEEAFFAASHIVKACETQLQLLPVGVDNLVLIPEESRKAIFVDARRPPEDLEKKFAAAVATVEANAEAAAAAAAADGAAVAAKATTSGAPKWRVGGAEFEALMRMLDNAGYRTGYIYRHPLIKSDPPKPKNDVELPPAVSSLGYLLEEEELWKQGIWKKGDFRKGGDRSRWLNSPNVYQKVEVLETGTPDPKKITKWVAEDSPTHSTPVRIEDPLQFVPAGTNPKEFKRLQQQIKDNRRADKISAGPQSHILEGVTWDEANRIKDATVSSAGDHVVLMGAASKGIIQRGYQHNAAVYKAPYAKNPFDNVTDDELNEYKRTVERKKKSIHGEYTDTDFSESEPLSSMAISAPQQTKQITITTAAVSQSEPEDISEHQVMRIETQQAPVPSQPEVVLSDATLSFLNGERSHTAVNRKPPTGRDIEEAIKYSEEEVYSSSPIYEKITEKSYARNSSGTNSYTNSNNQFHRVGANEEANINIVTSESPKEHEHQSNKENIYSGNNNIKRNTALIAELKTDALFQRQKHKLQANKNELKECIVRQGNIHYNKISSDSEKCTVRLGDSGCERLGSSYNASLGGNLQQQRINVEAIGFRPIHPIETCVNAPETFAQQPQFCNADPNNNGGVGGQVAGAYNHHQHCRHYHQRHRQHAGPAVGIVTLPHFEQAFGHMLDRPDTDVCAIYCDNYAPSYEPIYDRPQYANAAHTASVVTTTTDFEEAENPYKKSNTCCTPAVCDRIFESLRQPTASDNNLIFNIPFTAESPDTTITSVSTPRKTRADLPHKTTPNGGDGKGTEVSAGNSPYRTLSHFGFNSPQRDPQPDHKHIPCATEQRKYVALRKSISYEEIFSSPRYVDLCENCFEKIVRLKPEIAQQTQMRLRNLCDLNGGTTGGVAGCLPGGTCPGIMYQPGSDGIAYDYAEYASSDTDGTLPPFSSQLEPVLEVVEETEPDSVEDVRTAKKVSVTNAQTLERTPSNSSFIEKIMRLNYSEESANWRFAHTPHKVVSSTNLTLELERAIMENSQREQQPMSRDAEAAVETKQYSTELESELKATNMESTAYVNLEDVAVDSPCRPSVTEIWEFMKWHDEADASAQQQQPTDTSYSQTDTANMTHSGAICLYYENACESASNNSKTIENPDTFPDSTPQHSGNEQPNTSGASASASAAATDNSTEQKRRRSLMTREERSRRKLVFQELWEDHIFFLDGKELNTLSDTESAIDGQREQSAARAQSVEGITADSDATSVGVEQDVTDELNEGNEFLVVRTAEGDLMPSVVPTTLQSSASPQLIESEVFNSRSVILKNCSSGTALLASNEYDDDLDTVRKSEALMKLRTTPVRCEEYVESLTPAAKTIENNTTVYNVSEEHAQRECDRTSTLTPKSITSVRLATSQKGSEECDGLSTTMPKASTLVQWSPSNERSERVLEQKTVHALTSLHKAAHFDSFVLKSGPEDLKPCEAYSPEANVSFTRSIQTDVLTETQETEPEKALNIQYQQPLPKTDHRLILNATSHKAKPVRKSFVVTNPMPNANIKPLSLKSKVVQTSPEPKRRVEADRPLTPKPPITKSKHRKLSTPEPQATILESEPNLACDLEFLSEVSTSESDDDQSARTYNAGSSQECMFFLENELAYPPTDGTSCRIDSDSDEVYLTTNERDVDGVKAMGPDMILAQHDASAELEVADILINELKASTRERAKAGMALPTDDQKPKLDQNTGARSTPNVARATQLTTQALKESSSKVYGAPRTTKRPHRKTNVLGKSTSNVASTSVQATQRTAEELKLTYEPNVEEYVLFNQNIPFSTTRTRAAASERGVTDSARVLDKDEIEFAELLESDEHEDLTKLNEEFEELLLNVESLQLQPQIRELGGAENTAAEDPEVSEVNNALEIVEETDSHLNAMERKILRKIRESQLNESEEIFDKIEATIRNKVTLSQMELLVKEQSQGMSDQTLEESKTSHSTFTASTPERFSSAHSTFGQSMGNSFVCEQVSDIVDMAESVSALEPSIISIGGANPDESSTLSSGRAHSYNRHSTDSGSTRVDFSLATTACSAAGKLRRSRSLTPCTQNCELSSPPPKLNKTTTPPHEARESLSARDSQKGVAVVRCASKVGARISSRWPHASSSTPELQPSKRNFILENIRNASKPRQSATGGVGGGANSVKRLQGNAQAIFCKNPFGSVRSTAYCSKMLISNMSNSSLASSTASSSRTVVKSSSSQTIKQLSPRNSSTGVYTFQSKLVRGSPRIWVSLTQPTVKKFQTQKRRRRSQQQHHHRTMRIEAHDSTGSLREYAELMDNDQEGRGAQAELEYADEVSEHCELKCAMQAEEEVEEGVDSGAVGAQAAMSVEIAADSEATDRFSGGGGVEHELAALGAQIEQIQPRLDNYKRKIRGFGDHVAKCTRHMDDCIAVRADIAEEQRQLREQITLQQYADHILCQVQTYSISETED